MVHIYNLCFFFCSCNYNSIVQGSYSFEFFKFHDFPWLLPWPFLVFHDLRFSCHFRKFTKNFTFFSLFFHITQFNRNKPCYPPKCVSFKLFNYSSLLYIILALSSVLTNLPNKTFKDQKLFHDFTGLENEILKFHDFAGFPWPIRTLLLVKTSHVSITSYQ